MNGRLRVVLVVALLLLAAMGLSGAGALHPRLDGPLVGEREAALVATVALAAIGIWAATKVRRREEDDEDEGPVDQSAIGIKPLLVALAVGLVVAVVIALLIVLILSQHHPLTAPPSTPTFDEDGPVQPAPVPAPGPLSHGSPLDVAIVVLALAALAAALFLRPRRRPARPDDAPTAEDEDTVDRAVTAAIAALDEDVVDDRSAVLAAYAAMERELAARGTPRAQTETPSELVLRAAADGRLDPGPARRLLELFAEARFSSHPVGPGHREAALAALRELRAVPWSQR